MPWMQKHEVTIVEQDVLVPGRSQLAGLIKYLQIAGFRYVLAQAGKQWLFQILRNITQLSGYHDSLYFPYSTASQIREIRVTRGISKSKGLAFVRRLTPDLILSIYSKEILSAELLQIPRYGTLNLHPGYLPEYKGVSPVFWNLVNGEKFAGATLHVVDPGIDTGAVISRARIPITDCQSEHKLYERCNAAGKELLFKFLTDFFSHPYRLPQRHKNKLKGGKYYSLPTNAAVTKFLKNGNRFWSWKQLFSAWEILPGVSLPKAIRFLWYGTMIRVFNLLFTPINVWFLRLIGARLGEQVVMFNVVFINLYHYGFSRLSIGNECFFGNGVMLDCRGPLVIQDQVTISSRVNLVTHINVGFASHPLQDHYPASETGITIKSGVYIGTNATILPGVTIGEGSVVAAGAVVTKSVPPGVMVAGVPAVIKKHLKSLK